MRAHFHCNGKMPVAVWLSNVCLFYFSFFISLLLFFVSLPLSLSETRSLSLLLALSSSFLILSYLILSLPVCFIKNHVIFTFLSVYLSGVGYNRTFNVFCLSLIVLYWFLHVMVYLCSFVAGLFTSLSFFIDDLFSGLFVCFMYG